MLRVLETAGFTVLVIAHCCAISEAAPRPKPKAKAECAAGFSSTAERRPYALTSADWTEIAEVCSQGRLRDSMSGLLSAKPPEFISALLWQCNAGSRDSIDFLAYTLFSQLGVPDASGTRTKAMAILAKGPPKEGIHAEVQAAWKQSSLNRFDRAFGDGHELGSGFDAKEKFLAQLLLAKPYLPEDRLKAAIRLLASEYSTSMGNSGMVFDGIYPPKAYQMAKQAVRKALGMDYIPLTDLLAVRRQGKIEFKVISVDPPSVGPGEKLEGSYGLYAKTLREVEIPEAGGAGSKVLETELSWKVGTKDYKGQVAVTLGEDVSTIAPSIPKLDYDQMWADGKFTGIILPGSNMGTGESGAREVMENYQAYYRAAGFRFGRAQPVDDIQDFLRKEVASGRADYLVKEAHSDGSDRALVNLIPRGKIVTGRRKAGAGEEVVHIYFPSEERVFANSYGTPLPVTNVGQWMKERESAGGGQLFFIDTSCHGMDPACNLVKATQNKNLVVSGTTEQVDTFTGETDDAMVYLLDGIRKKKSFAEIKAESRAASSNADFHFPSEKEWEKIMRANDRRTTHVDLSVTENGRVVDIESMERER